MIFRKHFQHCGCLFAYKMLVKLKIFLVDWKILCKNQEIGLHPKNL